MLRLGPRTEWEPPIVKTSTMTGEGIGELWEAIERHRSFLTEGGELERRRSRRILTEVEGMVAERLRARASGMLRSGALDGLAAALAARSLDPYAAADQLMTQLTETI
jgi:LAO/AO transport system kinase